jgi:hypothetical protein
MRRFLIIAVASFIATLAVNHLYPLLGRDTAFCDFAATSIGVVLCRLDHGRTLLEAIL